MAMLMKAVSGTSLNMKLTSEKRLDNGQEEQEVQDIQ
jgi:hypothetical protein